MPECAGTDDGDSFIAKPLWNQLGKCEINGRNYSGGWTESDS